MEKGKFHFSFCIFVFNFLIYQQSTSSIQPSLQSCLVVSTFSSSYSCDRPIKAKNAKKKIPHITGASLNNGMLLFVRLLLSMHFQLKSFNFASIYLSGLSYDSEAIDYYNLYNRLIQIFHLPRLI